MEKKDWNRFVSVMARLCGEYGATIDEDNIKLKFSALSGLSIEIIQEACTWIIKNRKRPYFPPLPTTSEILEAVRIVSNDEGTSEIELDIILNHLKFYGATKKLPKDIHPKTHYLMTYRWPYLSWAEKILESDIKWFKNDFKKEFKELKLEDTEKFLENINHPLIDMKSL
jgi:hypothetical protein